MFGLKLDLDRQCLDVVLHRRRDRDRPTLLLVPLLAALSSSVITVTRNACMSIIFASKYLLETAPARASRESSSSASSRL